MAETYTLTWSGLDTLQVNGVPKVSPYTLKFGDIIYARSDIIIIGNNTYDGQITVNDVVYKKETKTIKLEDTNIVLKGAHITGTAPYKGCYLTMVFFISNGKPTFKFINNQWEQIEAFQYVKGFWGKMSEKVVIPTGFNVSLSVESQEIQEGRTYVKLNTRPTSLSDYDYVTSDMTAGQDNTLYDNSGGIVSQPATIASVSKLYIWSTFSNSDCIFNGVSKDVGAPSSVNDVVELNVTQDSTLIIKQYWY